jgi:hypothetical protein
MGVEFRLLGDPGPPEDRDVPDAEPLRRMLNADPSTMDSQPVADGRA